MKHMKRMLLSIACGIAICVIGTAVFAETVETQAASVSTNVPATEQVVAPVAAKPATTEAASTAASAATSSMTAGGIDEEEEIDLIAALAMIGSMQKDFNKLKIGFLKPKAGGKTVSQEFKEQVAAFNAIDPKDSQAKTRALIKLLIIAFAPLQNITNVTANASSLINASMKGAVSAIGVEDKMKSVTNGTKSLTELTKTANNMVKSMNKALLQTFDSIRDADAAKQGKPAPQHTPGTEGEVVAVDVSDF